MAIYFHNPGHMELELITYMGLSIKEENSIGTFGTGFKYSLGWLVRNNAYVHIKIGDRAWVPEALPRTLRGKEFNAILLKGQTDDSEDIKLGFTDQLGKNWNANDVFRELYCNALDEGGSVSIHKPTSNPGTVILVSHPEIDTAHRTMAERFIIDRKPWTSNHIVELYEPIKQAGDIYLKGVKIADYGAPFDINVTDTSFVELTEDRTLKWSWMVTDILCESLALIEDWSFLLCPQHMDEGSYVTATNFMRSFHTTDIKHALKKLPDDSTFMQFLKDNHSDIKLLVMARNIWEEANPKAKPFDLWKDHHYQSQISRACTALNNVFDMPIRSDDINVTRSFGDNKATYAIYHAKKDEIWISEAALERGLKFTIRALHEEWLHKSEGLIDCSRSMQNRIYDLFMEHALKGEIK